MKKTTTLALGFVLSGFLITGVNAGENNGTGAQQADGLGSAQSGTSAQTSPHKGLSKRNKAVLEQSKAAKTRREQIQSSATGTMPQKSGLSKRNKAMMEQSNAAKMKREKMQSGITGTMQK